jgi:hypothetical protein
MEPMFGSVNDPHPSTANRPKDGHHLRGARRIPDHIHREIE